MQSEHPEYGYGMTLSACLWIGLFPLLQGGTYTRITHDKWVAMLVLCGVTLCCFFFDLIYKRFRRKGSPAVLPDAAKAAPGLLSHNLPVLFAAALLLWTVLSCIFSKYGADTWWNGKYARYEGLLTQLCYFGLFFCFFYSRVNLKPVLFSAAAGVAVFFVVVMLQRSGGNPLGLFPDSRGYADGREFQGTIGNIDMGTGYLLLIAGLLLSGLLRCFPLSASHAPFLTFVAVFVFSVGLILSLYLIITMEVQFGIISLCVLFLITLLCFLPKKRRLPLLILLIVLMLIVVWFWPGENGGLWELHEIIHGRGRLSFGSNRVAVWAYSLRMAQENLLLGGGSGTFQSRFNRFLSDNSLVIPDEQDGAPLPDYFDNPHNEYIAQMTDHGLPAMLLFLTLLFSVFMRRPKYGLPCLAPCSAAVLCYMVQAFFSFSVCIVAPMFWILLSLSFKE